MTFSPSKSTIFVPKNLRNSPKICVDCSATDANYYSYAFKVYLCSECAKIHDTYLGKYDLEAQLRYHCPLLQVEDSYNENYYFNREFEEFLPEFFQKMGARTPEVSSILSHLFVARCLPIQLLLLLFTFYRVSEKSI